MKKLTSLFLAILVILSIGLSGCNNKDTKPKPTTPTESLLTPSDSNKMLTDYYQSFFQGDNPFYGIWQVKGVSYVYFAFRNDNFAQMIMGTEAYFTEMKINEKSSTIDVSFLITLNGKYKYKFSKDKNTLTLTKKNSKTVMEKVDDYKIIPEKPENPTVDKKLLGWWKSDNGQIYYFGKDGLMYSNGIINETFYTYETKNNVVHAVYQYDGDIKDSFGYEFKPDGSLIIENNTYKTYNPFDKK